MSRKTDVEAIIAALDKARGLIDGGNYPNRFSKAHALKLYSRANGAIGRLHGRRLPKR